jgi:hypothetical protein
MACLLLIVFTLLSFFGSVLTAAPSSISYTGCVQGPTYDLVSDSGKVPDPTASNQYHRVLLKVVPFAGDVCRYLHLVRQPYPGYLSKGGVRLSRRLGPDLNTNAAHLRRARASVPTVGQGVEGIPERRSLLLLPLRFPALANKLICGRHEFTL